MAQCYQCLQDCTGACIGYLRTYLPCICFICPYPYIQVQLTLQIDHNSKGLKTHFGQYVETADPGLHYFNVCTQWIDSVSLQTMFIDLKATKIFTKDNVAATLDTVVFYRIIDPFKAKFKVADLMTSIAQISYASIRVVAGQYVIKSKQELQDLLINRKKIAQELTKYVQKQVQMWGILIQQGIYIDHILIKDFIISKELERNLSAVSVMKRVVESKLISAEADVRVAQMQKQASQILSTKAAMQIRYLQSIDKYGSLGKKIIILPLQFEQVH